MRSPAAVFPRSALTIRQETVFSGHLPGRPKALLMVGRWLVVLVAASDTAAVSVEPMNGKTGGVLSKTVENGTSLFSAWAIAPTPGDAKSFWVFDVTGARLARVQIDNGTFRPQDPIDLISDAHLMDAAPLTDSTFVATGLFTRSRVAFFDRTGRLRRLGGLPPPGPSTLPMAVRQQAQAGRLTVNPARGRIAIANAHSGEIEILNIDGSALARSDVRPLPSSPLKWTTLGGSTVLEVDTLAAYGYIDVASTTDLIVALFSGSAATPRGSAPSGGRIDLLDWNGRRLEAIELEGGDLIAIAIDSARSFLYGLTRDRPPRVVRLDLRDLAAVGLPTASEKRAKPRTGTGQPTVRHLRSRRVVSRTGVHLGQ